MKLTRWSIPHHPIFKVGDRVLVPWDRELKIPAIVIEDRGPLAQGKQIVRVRFLTDIVAPYEESEYLAEMLEPDSSPTKE
jgi:primosomal protein N'